MSGRSQKRHGKGIRTSPSRLPKELNSLGFQYPPKLKSGVLDTFHRRLSCLAEAVLVRSIAVDNVGRDLFGDHICKTRVQ